MHEDSKHAATHHRLNSLVPWPEEMPGPWRCQHCQKMQPAGSSLYWRGDFFDAAGWCKTCVGPSPPREVPPKRWHFLGFNFYRQKAK